MVFAHVFRICASVGLGLLLSWCAESIHTAYWGTPGVIGWLIRITMFGAALFFTVEFCVGGKR